MKMTAKEVAAAVGGEVIHGDPSAVICSIATDSNKITEKAIFVPILGARVNGHRFIGGAFANGAAASFTAEALSEETLEQAGECPVIRVTDTLAALQQLGTYYRNTYVKIPYVGVTGSVGKTTTREMIACALSAGLNTYSTKGNANSQTGVPITVSDTAEDAEIGVIEMGMSEFDEMHRLSMVVQPDMAVMTIIGISHIANLGSQENIRKEKLHILDGMKDGGLLLVNGDDPMLRELDAEMIHSMGIAEGKTIRIARYGTGENAKFRAVSVSDHDGVTGYELIIDGTARGTVRLTVPGMHMVLNSLAALAVAYESGVALDAAIRAIGSFSSLDGRGKIVEKQGVKIINDGYNAAPQSMIAGLAVLDTVESAEGGRHIAVLADMLELGPEERRWHRDIGTYIAEKTAHIDHVLLYGSLAEEICAGVRAADRSINVVHTADYDTLFSALKDTVAAGDVVFFKGSNSMKLWKMAGELADYLGD